jgi:hypothetical protein
MKRFISGARCPKCQSLDSLRVWKVKTKQFMDCNHCDYQQTIDNAKAPLSSAKIIGVKTLE